MTEFLNTQFNVVLRPAIYCLSAALVGYIAAWLAQSALKRWSERTATSLDNALLLHLSGPFKVLLPLIGVTITLPTTGIPEPWPSRLGQGFLIADIAATAWLLLRVFAVIETTIQTRYDLDGDNRFHARQVQTQVRVLRNIATFVTITLAIGLILTTFETVRQLGAGLLASAGVAGIVIGFAAQRSIAAVVGGVQLALTQPIRVDDVLIVEGEWGRVEEITLTYVVLRIWDLRRLVVPITYFLEKPFENWTRTSAELLGAVELEIDFRVPVDPIRNELLRLLQNDDRWDQKVWSVQVTAASGRTMRIRALMSAANASNLWDLRCFVREHLIAFIERQFTTGLPRDRVEWTTPPQVLKSANTASSTDASVDDSH